MIITKELATKGAAILGSAGAGGTGLYYGGNYMSGLSRNATTLQDHVQENKKHYFVFGVKKQDSDNDWMDLSASNDINFSNKDSFEVKVTSTAMSNAMGSNTQGDQKNISSASAVSCTFKFEVDGNKGSATTIKHNHKKRIFWEPTPGDQLGLFGLISQHLYDYPSTLNDSKLWSMEDIRKLRNDFMSKCDQQQKKNEPITVKFKKEEGGNQLVPVNETSFNHWFLSEADSEKKMYKENNGV